MQLLTQEDALEVSGAKFRLHFDPIALIAGVVVGAITAGPLGIGAAVTVALVTQAGHELNNMHTEHQAQQAAAQKNYYYPELAYGYDISERGGGGR